MKFKAAIVLVLSLLAVSAQALTPEREAELKEAYLVCDKMASEAMLSPADAALCSEVHEALLKEVFDGDFNKLLEWWRQAKN